MKAENVNETTFKDIFKQIVGNDSYQTIADKIGVSRQNIYYWINGKSLPDTAALIKIADAYNVTVDYLLGRKQQLDPFYSNAEIRRYMERFARYSDFTESWITEYARYKVVGKVEFRDKEPWTEQQLMVRLKGIFSSVYNWASRPSNTLYPASYKIFDAIEDEFYNWLCSIYGCGASIGLSDMMSIITEGERINNDEYYANKYKSTSEILNEMREFKNSAASACMMDIDEEEMFFELYEESRLIKAVKGLIGNETICFLRSSKHISNFDNYTERIREATREGD